ncbi:hypothetical protein SRS16CHR_03834 [Variovorax sp. SRS16]|uniref:DUF433 domain-containing protein n=1 Tax=Variovorax sp. SRS16 TaxID=282217 RepID=UPI0013174474|nr:DUF433 domain-containing protein [Variovorax sp. SRS16]VTU26318.1 hypothetical protein SRS16CHR_03834 [Variovorax sp. SRS16]
MVATTEPELLNVGIYSLPQAARLIDSDLRAVRRWMRGYGYRRGEAFKQSPPLWKTQLASAEFTQPAIGFRDLLELRFVRAFVNAGVSLHVVKATIEAARALWHADYPLTTRRFLTDGKDIFESAVTDSGEETLTDLRRHQVVFTHIIKPSLYTGIDYTGDIATAWHPPHAKGVILDPSRQFGQPIVVDVGVPTDTLYASYVAEGRNRKAVARQFDIEPRHVDAAVRYEERLPRA